MGLVSAFWVSLTMRHDQLVRYNEVLVGGWPSISTFLCVRGRK
jgi:hypothetical protein